MQNNEEVSTLEWFGVSTFRLKTRGLAIFLDSWLEKPATLQPHLSIDTVTEADYIFISHAHFDHLPGADRIARQTGAIIVANCEAINLLEAEGIPEKQLLRVSGGERVPLFTRQVREQAERVECEVTPAPPGAPVLPHSSLAAVVAHIWPALHCLMPGGPGARPTEIDTGEVYTGEAHPCFCTIDLNRGMRHGLLKLAEHIPRDKMDPGEIAFAEYVADRKRNVFSHHDGGQLMVNFENGQRSLLWSSHLGGYEGILRTVTPKPDIAILGIAGRANLNGRPFDGSAAQFALQEIQWLGEPSKVIWCLQDESCIKPYRINTTAATRLVEENTRSRVMTLNHAHAYELDL